MRLFARRNEGEQATTAARTETAGGIPDRIFLDVPFEENETAKALGARFDPAMRQWWTSTGGLTALAHFLPAVLVDLGPSSGPRTSIAILGLPDACYRCGELATALVGMIEPGGDLFGSDLVLCDSELPLALADRYLPEEARLAWHVGEIRRRYSRTVRSSYLANGCAGCGAIRGQFPLFHEDVPEALAVRGTDAFEALAIVDMPRARWILAEEDRYNT